MSESALITMKGRKPFTSLPIAQELYALTVVTSHHHSVVWLNFLLKCDHSSSLPLFPFHAKLSSCFPFSHSRSHLLYFLLSALDVTSD